MGGPHGWVGIKVRWATGMGGPPGNGEATENWAGHQEMLGSYLSTSQARLGTPASIYIK